MRALFVVGAAAALGCASLALPAQAQLYQIVDLGNLGGPMASAAAINKAGVVTGVSWNNVGDDRAFRTGKYVPIDPATDNLGHLGGSESQGFAINDASTVVGSSSNGFGNWRAFRRTTLMTDLGTLGGNNSWAYGINATNQIVGASQNAAANLRAFLFNGGAMASLGTLGGADSSALGINSGGRIVGWAEMAGGIRHAFRTAPLAAINPATDDLGTLGGVHSEGYAINNAGAVVGRAQDGAGDWLAFKYSGGAMTSLGTLGGASSEALAINTAGVIVGSSATAAPSTHAFVYAGGIMTDLNDFIGTTGWELTKATGINDNGDIVGFGTLAGQTHAYLLRPIRVKTFVLSPSTVVGCNSSTGKLTLNLPAPAELNVQIKVLNPAAHVTTSDAKVLAGATTSSFTIFTDPVAAGTTGAIQASYGGAMKSAMLTVLPISVKSVSLSPSQIVGCKVGVGKVVLECPAAPGDITVTLTSADPALASVPASITIAAGAVSGTFPITTTAVTTNTTVAIQAAANGRSRVANLTIKPIPARSVTFLPPSVIGGTPSTGKVTLECPAGPGDIVVTLVSLDTSVATVPATVTVPMGASSATFTVTTVAPAAVTKVGIQATAGGVTKTGYLTVSP
jgi:probable HAF family extracellular repeat protein